MNTFYHYTTGICLDEIIASGELQVSVKEWQSRAPVLWLSTNSLWENSVSTPIEVNGKSMLVFKKDLLHQLFGLIRFKVPLDDYMQWHDFFPASLKSRRFHKAMKENALKAGAKTKDWFVSYDNISLEHCKCEKWNGINWMGLRMASIPEQEKSPGVNIL